MTENEFLLEDRLTKVRSVIGKYGEDNFFLSFSGGKDSTVLSALVDMAIPDNKIPRVYANTGIEYRLIVDFVERERVKPHPWELVILKPSVPIKPMLEQDGYPFKSKYHARAVEDYKRTNGKALFGKHYYEGANTWSSRNCPQILKYQFETDMPFRISGKCCDRMKKEPIHKWQRENNKPYGILGIMPSEGGQRESAKCLAFSGNRLKNFQPLVPVTKEWEDWFIDTYSIEICDIYKPPYSFERTGCKGCPFNLNLQNDLEIIEKFFPDERKQCEIIWKPVYDEYRRIGYRLKDGKVNHKKGHQMTVEEWFSENNLQ